MKVIYNVTHLFVQSIGATEHAISIYLAVPLCQNDGESSADAHRVVITKCRDHSKHCSSVTGCKEASRSRGNDKTRGIFVKKKKKKNFKTRALLCKIIVGQILLKSFFRSYVKFFAEIIRVVISQKSIRDEIG